MGLTKRILCPGPAKESTKEEKEQLEQLWKILCEKGSVCVTDPTCESDETIEEILAKNPYAFTEAHCDYHGDNDWLYGEFLKQIIEGRRHKK